MFIASRKLVPTVVPGVIVDTSRSSDDDAASGDRPPIASGDREQDIPDWLQPFTEGLVEGESGSPDSAGETIPKTPPHIPARFKNAAPKSSKALCWMCPERGGRQET